MLGSSSHWEDCVRSTTDGRGARRGRRSLGTLSAALLALGVLSAARCGGQAPAAAGPPPALPVEAIVLGNAPVERTSEFIGTVKSRSSTTVQPQVEGIITRIAVASGARVSPGQVLIEIDAQRQQALVSTLESQRAAREAELGLARQQAERAKTLLEAGAGSARPFGSSAWS
jgi:multidrug efflux pump subunit AcrA (membrane-fusion protein)